MSLVGGTRDGSHAGEPATAGPNSEGDRARSDTGSTRRGRQPARSARGRRRPRRGPSRRPTRSAARRALPGDTAHSRSPHRRTTSEGLLAGARAPEPAPPTHTSRTPPPPARTARPPQRRPPARTPPRRAALPTPTQRPPRAARAPASRPLRRRELAALPRTHPRDTRVTASRAQLSHSPPPASAPDRRPRHPHAAASTPHTGTPHRT